MRVGGVLDVLRHLERGELWAACWACSRASASRGRGGGRGLRRPCLLFCRSLVWSCRRAICFSIICSMKGARSTSARSSSIFAACAAKFLATWARTSTPTRSARRKVPVLGQPRAVPVRVSTSSMVRFCSIMRRMALPMEKVPMRLAMKFGVSCEWTMVFPRRWSQKCSMAAMSAGSVSGVGMISSRRM